MASSTVASLLVLGGLALIPVRYWFIRSWRTYGLLGGGAAIVLGLQVTYLPLFPVLQTGLVAGIGLAILGRNESLWAMTNADHDFIGAYSAIGSDMKALNQVVDSTPPAVFRDRFSDLIARLEKVQAPSADWVALQKDAVAQLKKRLSAMRAGVLLSDDEFAAFDHGWREIQDRFLALSRGKADFWLPWP